jgi:hypothetical protein
MEGICYRQSSDVIDVGEDVGVDDYGFVKERFGDTVGCGERQDEER